MLARTGVRRLIPGLASPRIVRLNGACGRSRLRSFIAIAAVVGVLAILGHSALLRSEAHAAHSSEPFLTSLSSAVDVNVDHAHLVDGWSTAHPEVFANAVLPRSISGLASLGAVVAAVALTGWFVRLLVLAGRSPPRGLAADMTGQDLLTRFCLSRR